MIRTDGLTKRFGRDHRRRRHRPRRARGRRLRLPRRQRLRQDHDRADAARAGAGHLRARSRCSAGRCRRSGREVLPQVGALVEGPAAYPQLSGRDQPRAPRRASAPGGARRTRAGRVDDALEQVGLGGVDERPVRGLLARHAAAPRPGRSAAARAAAAGARRADQRPRPAGHPRDPRSCCSTSTAAGTTVFLSSHLLAEVEQMCTRVGVLDRGRLVLQDAARPTCSGPTGRTCVRTPDVGAARGAARRPGRASRRRPRCWSGSDDPAALNARLVGGGVRVTELAPERRTLEESCLEARPTTERR